MHYNPFTDYDKHGILKLPWHFYFCLAFLLRSYVIWIVALSYRQDTGGLLSLFYPVREHFTEALLVALPSVIVAIVASVRRPNMAKLARLGWHQVRWLMAGAASVQLGYALSIGNLTLHNIRHILVTYPTIVEMVGLILVILYCVFNQRFIDCSEQFPTNTED